MSVNTKYAIGIDVWMIYCNKARQFEVSGVFIDVTSKGVEIFYTLKGLGDGKYGEDILYPTKEELLESL